MRTYASASPLAVVALLLLAAQATGETTVTSPLKVGIDPGGISALASKGAKPDYAMFWAGSWNEKSGWSGIGSQAKQISDQHVIPVVEWWYWGDDISPDCVTNGCKDRYQGVWKNRTDWARDAVQLADALHKGLAGRYGVVVLETEFNKNGIQTWEAFDGYLAEHAAIFRHHVPEARLVLGFGNWDAADWGRFDRAAGAVDMVGFQTMRAKTHDSRDTYLGAVDAIKSATSALHSTFGKPVLLHDLALGSYDNSTWAGYQRQVVGDLFARSGELQDAGLVGVIYRALKDNPNADPANYYGYAERTWGLSYANGTAKPALSAWVSGVKAVRGASSAPTSTSSAAGGLTWQPRDVGNDWWVAVRVSGAGISGVDADVGGTWHALALQSYGDWARSLHAPDGTKVQFRAHTPSGLAYSPTYTWSQLAASFTPKSVGNDWWVEVGVKANLALAKVEARLNGGAWQALPKDSWGTYAASLHAPSGTKVQFRATATDGESVSSTSTTWT